MSNRGTWKRVFSTVWAGVDGARKVMHLLVLLFIFTVLVSALSSQAPSLPTKAALVIRPVGSLLLRSSMCTRSPWHGRRLTKNAVWESSSCNASRPQPTNAARASWFSTAMP